MLALIDVEEVVEWGLVKGSPLIGVVIARIKLN